MSSEASWPCPRDRGQSRGCAGRRTLGPGAIGPASPASPAVILTLPVFLKDLARPSLPQTCLWSKEVPPQRLGHRW